MILVAIQNLPDLPYATTMDKYVFAGLGLIFVLLIETVIGNQLSDDAVDTYEDIFRSVLSGCWGLYNLVRVWCFLPERQCAFDPHCATVLATSFSSVRHPCDPMREQFVVFRLL